MGDAFVVLMQVHLFFPESGSLKAKRSELNSVKAHLRTRNGATVASSAAAGTIQSVNSVWIGGINSYSSHTDRECAFASIGEGLTDAEMGDLYTIVQTFQTALGRNV